MRETGNAESELFLQDPDQIVPHILVGRFRNESRDDVLAFTYDAVQFTVIAKFDDTALDYFGDYCFGCPAAASKKGNLDMESLFDQGDFDATLIFENLITGKMPPKNKKRPPASLQPNQKMRPRLWPAPPNLHKMH